MSTAEGRMGPRGALGLHIDKALPDPDVHSLWTILRWSLPWFGQAPMVWRWRLRNLPHFLRGFRQVALARLFRLPTHYGVLWLQVQHLDGTRTTLGLASLRVVTTTGATKIVDFMRASDTATGQAFKFHGLGTGSTAEATADTALVTELTTQYNPDNTRATGTQTNNGATVYRTVGTNTLDASVSGLQEHGIFSAASGGSLLDRTVFASLSLASGDALTTTYDFTVNAGS